MRRFIRLLMINTFLTLSLAGRAGEGFVSVQDSLLLSAFRQQDMTVWDRHIDSLSSINWSFTTFDLLYEYGLCGDKVDKDKQHALAYVKRFKAHVEEAKELLPAGHYEMYRSAIYVYEMGLHYSMHPIRSMDLAKQATRLAPTDPVVLSYYGTCFFYAPKPFGSKSEALKWFLKAEEFFSDILYKFCWVREANEMYIQQCREKLKKR